MNLFNGNRMTPQQVIAIAEATGMTPLAVAIKENGYGLSTSFWESPKEISSNQDKYPVISLGNDQDVVGRLVTSVARSVQFPESSAYVHFLGCVSAAMLGRFTVEYHGSEQPTALYTIISQPPSTGKSAINDYATKPIIAEVMRINEMRKKERKQLMGKLSALKAEMKGEKSQSEMADLYQEKDELEEKLEKMGDIIFPVSDTTPEGLARINYRQGNFAIISDEATSINTLLGLSYQDSSRKVNSELVLKAWDNGKVSVARANADNNMSFDALGAIAVIAQDETINSIMQAGDRGIGVSERFLLVRERSMLGNRKFTQENGKSAYQPVDKSLVADYYKLIHEIMSDTNVKLEITDKAMVVISTMRDRVEPELGDGGKYAHTMLRGAIGKFDKQVIRIASVLHVIRNWSPGNSSAQKSRKIDHKTIQEAIAIYEELSKTYISSASAAGYAGEDAEMRVLCDTIIKRGPQTKGSMKVRTLIEYVRRVKPFYGQSGVTMRMEEVLIPKLEEANYLLRINDDLYINPTFVGRG